MVRVISRALSSSANPPREFPSLIFSRFFAVPARRHRPEMGGRGRRQLAGRSLFPSDGHYRGIFPALLAAAVRSLRNFTVSTVPRSRARQHEDKSVFPILRSIIGSRCGDQIERFLGAPGRAGLAFLRSSSLLCASARDRLYLLADVT